MLIILTGFIGMTLILFAFFMNQANKWKADYLVYDLFNSIGGLLLVVYAILIESYPFLVLNSIWTIVSVRDVVLGLQKKTKKWFTSPTRKNNDLKEKK